MIHFPRKIFAQFHAKLHFVLQVFYKKSRSVKKSLNYGKNELFPATPKKMIHVTEVYAIMGFSRCFKIKLQIDFRQPTLVLNGNRTKLLLAVCLVSFSCSLYSSTNKYFLPWQSSACSGKNRPGPEIPSSNGARPSRKSWNGK